MGGPFFYGHGNYLILGAVIERLTGKTYEQVMDEELFTPLGMTTAAFGMPYEPTRPGSFYQPHGHQREVNFPHATNVDNTACPPVWNPAGSCYLSMADWLRFLRFHLTGSGGLLSLSAARLNELHTPYPAGDSDSYGYGWGIDPKGPILTHGGSYGRFNAVCGVDVGNGIAVAAVTNLGPSAKYDGEGNVVWEETWSGLAIGQFYDYLRAQLLAKLGAGSDFVPGSFGFGSLGGQGLAFPALATDGRKLVGFENLWDLRLPESSGVAKFLGRDLYGWDDFHRRQLRFNQAPRYLGYFRGEDGVERIRYSANPGALYQILRSPTLEFSRAARPVDEIVADGETIDVPIEGRGGVDFYQVVEQ